MRRVLKISAWAAGSVLMLVLLLIGALFIAGNTDRGRVMIERLTHGLTSGHVALSGLAGSFPKHLTLEHLELRDDRGVWLTADRVTLSWSPLAMLARRIQVETLHAASVDMERLPEASPQPHNNEPVSIPRIDVGELTVDVVKLGEELAGMPASLVLRGSAHLRSVQDMIFDASAHRINGDGDYELHLRFDPKRMDAALNLHEPASGPLENVLKLPGLGALTASLNLSGLRAAERLEIAVAAGGFHGTAQGNFNLDELSADLDFAVDSAALAPRADLAWEHANAKGRWHGSLKSPHADAHVEADQVRLPGGAGLADLKADLTADSGAAVLHALVGGLQLPGPQPRLLRDSPLTIDAAMRLDQAARPLDLTATHRLFSLHALTELTPAAAGRRNVALELKFPDLTPLAALGGQNVRGSALVKGQLSVEDEAARLSLEATAALGGGTEVWSGVVGDRATLELSGQLTERAIVVDALKFTGRAVSLSANGQVSRPEPGSQAPSPASVRANWDLAASDLKLLSPFLAGTLKANGKVEGPATALAAEAQVSSTLSVRGSPTGALSASIKLRGLPSAPVGTFAAQGSLDGAPLHVDVALERGQAGFVRASIRGVDWKSAHIDGNVTVATADAQTRGQLRLQMGRLAELEDLIGTKVEGSLAGTVELHPVQGRTHVQIHADAHDVKVAQFAGNAQVTAEGVADKLGFKLEVQVPKLYGSTASLSADGSLNLDARAVTATHAVLNYRGQDMRLLSAAQIDLANGVTIERLKIGARQAVFQLDGELVPALDVRASLHQVQGAFVNAFAPDLLASGTIEASAQLQGSFASPTGQVTLSAKGLSFADDAAFGLPALDLNATAQLAGDTANIDARLVAGSESSLSVVGRVPLAATGAWDFKIGGALDVGMINPILEARGQHASGQLRVDATVAGSVAEPKIGGTVNLTNGSVRDYSHGVSLTDITAAVVGSEGTLQIKTFTATAAPGTVSMSGMVGILQPGLPVDLKIRAVNAQPIVSKLVTSNLNADVHISGTARARLDIGGTVHLNRTLIGIPNSLPPNVAVLDVRRRGKALPPPPDKPLVIGLDVTVQAPQEILVQGRGVDAEMGGDLHISGTTESPSVTGDFELIPGRGSFSIAGNRLTITTGRVSFSGAGLRTKIDPTLDFMAQTTTSTLAVASVHIFGLADAPKFEFTSNTGAPPDEIMAQLMFGVPASQLTPLQLAQAGAALATLSGVGGDGGLNPLVKIQKSLGLDRLNVGAAANTAPGTENTGAAIEAGRYITKRVYVEAKQSTTGSSQLIAVVDLTKHLKLQTRLGNGTATVVGTTPENDPGSSVGLQYQFEY
jgi:translocation and assembly module TamB